MSKFGETVDKILELLYEEQINTVYELEKKVKITDTAILDFMRDAGLIELNMQSLRITESAAELLVAELFP
ncbi:MAG TPA: hypothetical protein VJJ51_11330 [Candidatus Methanoperedens sp.]|nr:hypothetical protein [Candidatus Methanoperedens sp.]